MATQNPKTISVGPWGGYGGVSWDDGVNDGIRQIKLKMEPNLIHSIHIEYDCNGVSLWSEHGGSGGSQTYTIVFDYPTERITSISGHYGTSISGHYDTYVRSLTFESNEKIYGPYGVEDGTYFSFSMAEGKIVGFHGRRSDYLVCIGVYISKNLVGPWGGKSGNSWDDGVYDNIRQIILHHGSQIDSINIEYERNGASVWSKHGGTGGDNIDKIELDYPNERITSISGYYDTYVRSLTFESNVKKPYGPYGVEEGKYFSFSTAEGKIAGFHGRSGWYLDCIGVHISNVQATEISESLKPILFRSPPGGEGEDVWDGSPPGGEGEDVWDDGVYSGIRQIIVVYDEDFIDSIHIEYDNNGSPFWLERGGSTVRIRKAEKIQLHRHKETLRIGKIQLDYPREILTSINGYHATCLRSLTFQSNVRKYGPFGGQRGTPFESPKGDYKIVGFNGRSSSYFDPDRQSGGSYFYSLGVSLSPLPAKSVGSPWGGPDGDEWDDGEYSGIHQILVVYDENAIRSIHIKYDNNGSPFWRQHGGSIGNKIGKIQLDYPREILTSISGRYDNVMRSLTFKSKRSLTSKSNLKQYGPYGLQRGTHYFSSPSDVKIVGFHGSSSDESLHRIGVHLSNLDAAVHR